jgi:hypothetical protein
MGDERLKVPVVFFLENISAEAPFATVVKYVTLYSTDSKV